MNRKGNLFLIFVCFFSIQLYSQTATVTFKTGKVQITNDGKTLNPVAGNTIPDTAKIQTGKDGRLEFVYQEQRYRIQGNQTLVPKDSLAKNSLIEITKHSETSAGVRTLYDSLWVKMSENSEVAFKEYVKTQGGKIKNYKGWNKIVERIINKLIKASGNEPYKYQYAILKNPDFNAAAFPGGQFIIHTKTLDTLDDKVKLFKKKKLRDEVVKENLLAPILAHELAHYYNKHSYKFMKRVIGQADPLSEKEQFQEVNNIRFGQEAEIDADMTGSMYMQKAGYDVAWMLEMLNILKEIHSDFQKTTNNEDDLNPYFASHPSPNDRLSKFSSDKQTFYKLLSELEIAFANIQLGNGLGNALKTIDTALELETYKNNVDLLKAKAICIHKIWLNTVNVDDKRARSLLDMPSFKDSMLVNKEGTKGLFNGIPGEEDIYNLAKDAYKEVFDKSVPDPAFVSNYASLIVYEKKERDRAVVLSEFAARAGGIQTINNLAVVYLIAEKKEEALNLIMSLLINISTGLKIQALGFKSEYSDNEYIKQMEEKASIRKSFDPYYIPETTTVLLNSVLIARANKKKEDAKKLGEYYLSDFDSESKWAAYIKEELGLKTKFQPLSIEVSIEGIKMGDDKSIVSKKWKDPEVTTAFTIKDELDNEKNLDCEAMYYKKKNSRVIVCSGKVREIYFLHESNLKTNNNLKTGMNIEAVEKILGKKYQNQGGFRKYTLSNRSVFYLRFQDNILTEIYLVR